MATVLGANGLRGGSFSPRRPWIIPPALVSLILAAVSVDAYTSAFFGGPRPPDESHAPLLPEGSTASVLPKPYLGTSVTGAVVTFDASEVAVYDEAKKDDVRVDLEGQGPVLFSLPRWNQGDFAPRLQPLRPYSQPNLACILPGSVGSRFEQPSDIPAQAWRPSVHKGVVLGTVAQNGQKWNDTTPLFYGTVACVYASHGFGYNLDSGVFSNDNPNINIAIGKVGMMLEANIDVSIAWFPYHQGWLAGYVETPGEYSAEKAVNKWTTAWSYSPLLPSDASKVVAWDKYGARLTLPGVHAQSDGMLFLTSTNPGPGNNDGNVVSCYLDWQSSYRSWRVQVREDDEASTVLFCSPDQAMFAFAYIPYSAGGLIGGYVSGHSQCAFFQQRGHIECLYVSEGMYHFQLHRPGLDHFNTVQPLSNRDGMLLLQVVDVSDDRHFSRHTVLSYNILPNGTIEVQSHTLERNAQGQESYPAMDTDFYIAWVDFRTPLTPTPDTFSGSAGGASQGTSLLSLWDGLVAGLGFGALVLVAFAAALVVSARLNQRSSYLAMAPLPRTFPQDSTNLHRDTETPLGVALGLGVTNDQTVEQSSTEPAVQRRQNQLGVVDENKSTSTREPLLQTASS